MPLARYFIFVGGLLLALLFVANAELPKQPAAEATQAAYDATADLPMIRIKSNRKWPERVVFDTSMPTIEPPAATAQASVPAPTVVAQVSAKIRVRDAFAQLPLTDLELKSDPVKPQALAPKRRIAKRHVAPPMVLVAQQPQFGLIARNTW